MASDTGGAWTPVALSADLPAGVVIPAWASAESIALWRSRSGRLAASTDRCPHRGMRLSHGFVRGEALSCIYHGWSYDRTGKCLRIPAHPGLTPPQTIRAGAFDVEESGGVVWVAIGRPVNPPPRLEGLVPLRSLAADAPPEAIEAAAGAKGGPEGLDWTTGARAPIRLLLAAWNNQTLIHVLLDGGCTPLEQIAASRAAEALRGAAEAMKGETR
jgi:nitrite reductase/ring-hydroxylating ferredoxin subunit